MAALTNPFDVLPDNLFNVLSGHSGLQRHYLAILLRIYELAEFNRFGLTREVILAEIVNYLTAEDVEDIDALAGENTSIQPEGCDKPSIPWATLDCTPGTSKVGSQDAQNLEENDTSAVDAIPSDDVQEYASSILRRLVDAGWLEREQQADYIELITLPDYAFTLLEALRVIQEQKPREYTGQLYAAHQLLTNENEDFSPALALTQAYEHVRQVVRGLNELNQNIRRYTDRVTRDRPVAELLRLQYDDYAQVLGPSYHALKTSDHISRYRRDILARLQEWQLDNDWIDGTADELTTQSRLSPAQAMSEISHYLRFITNQLEGLDPLLGEIDRRHAQYLRTSLRQIRYQLVGADGGFKDRLALLARGLAAKLAEGEVWLPEEMPAFQVAPIRQPDTDSFYTLPKRRAPFMPKPVIAPILDPSDLSALRAITLEELGQAITPAKIQRFVGQFFNGHRAIHVRELPSDAFENEEDLPWLIYTIAYGDHPQVNYGIEPLTGEPVALGPVRVRPFQLVKKSPHDV
jgi:hypothetical protein